MFHAFESSKDESNKRRRTESSSSSFSFSSISRKNIEQDKLNIAACRVKLTNLMCSKEQLRKEIEKQERLISELRKKELDESVKMIQESSINSQSFNSNITRDIIVQNRVYQEKILEDYNQKNKRISLDIEGTTWEIEALNKMLVQNYNLYEFESEMFKDSGHPSGVKIVRTLRKESEEEAKCDDLKVSSQLNNISFF